MVKYSEKTPAGWRLMTSSEAQCLKPKLVKLLGPTDIVAVNSGALYGSYSNNKLIQSCEPNGCTHKLITKIQ